MKRHKELELISKILYDIDNMKKAIGRIEHRQVSMGYGEEPTEKEFKVYSQWGEDGIIQWLIDNIYI